MGTTCTQHFLRNSIAGRFENRSAEKTDMKKIFTVLFTLVPTMAFADGGAGVEMSWLSVLGFFVLMAAVVIIVSRLLRPKK